MKILIVVLCLPFLVTNAAAQIFKCTDNGSIAFSDSPCGKNSELIEVESPKRNNMQLSNQKMGELADELHTDRRKRELTNRVKRQRHHLKNINKNYQEKRDKLQKELSKVKAERQRYQRNHAPIQYSRIRDKENNLREKLENARQKYDSDKAFAKSELSESRRLKSQYE